MTREELIELSEKEYPMPKKDLYPTLEIWEQEKNRVLDMRSGFVRGIILMSDNLMKTALESQVTITSGGILLPDLRIEDFDYADRVKILIVETYEEPSEQ